jgi:pimeloyl-ACP methyl ester carboxylesterase
MRLILSSMLSLLFITSAAHADSPEVLHKTVKIGGVDIFYREAGPKDGPTILLLHGFPTSSQMYRNLIPSLADKYHVVAPDYPGFGQSSMPSREHFAYTFDHLAEVMNDFCESLELKSLTLYVQDYGAPVGFRLATAHPERIKAFVIQNGNAYDEGLANDFWKPFKAYWKEPQDNKLRDSLKQFLVLDATRWQYTHGVQRPELLAPETWIADQYLLDRPKNSEIQLDLFLSYGSNPAHYAEWQEYLRKKQPPVLIVWGKNDQIFPPAGAAPYKRDVKTLEYHLLDAGHFALETHGNEISQLMRQFLAKHVTTGKP